MLEPSAMRARLTKGVYVSKDENDPVGALEAALIAVIAAEAVEAKLRAAAKAGTLTGAAELADEALAKGVISQAERDILDRAAALRRKVIMVDDFPKDLGRSEITQTTQAVTFEALRA